MRGGLVAAAGQVQIDDGVRIQHAQAVEALGREVDARPRRRRRHEEDVLLLDERPMLGRDRLELFRHGIGPLQLTPSVVSPMTKGVDRPDRDLAPGLRGALMASMEQTGEHRIAAPRARVWDALNDPAVLKRCIDGCEELDALRGQRLPRGGSRAAWPGERGVRRRCDAERPRPAQRLHAGGQRQGRRGRLRERDRASDVGGGRRRDPPAPTLRRARLAASWRRSASG